ncbi:MAG: ATP-dependent RNA helicase HrpA [Desulfobacteraceae bacterium]|nr:MAG: ATP-dependent RNA helicase HrpA [Desulfobacteraceae bacterium]
MKQYQINIRKKNIPEFSFDPALPITAKKDEIIESISKNQVVIISGETGSGKTTQIPKFCLAAGRGIYGKIGCTQPRRIAAITVAARIAEELGEETGKSVGYKIRFTDKTRKDAFIKIMTDGILLAEAHRDPYLNEYDTIIVDEAHERNLNIDFILGLLKNLLRKRRNLKVVITSATIDTEKFSKAFDNAPVIEVSGRTFPVETHYMPVDPELEESSDKTHVDLAAEAVDKLLRESRTGDILIFMPTEQDIRETTEILEGRKYVSVEIMPIFARLPASEQSRVFKPIQARKIIIATNIAETSITIPGIKYVIDTGLARISHYSSRSRSTALPVVKISRSSADQRKGRCGRVENGVCIRLYPEEDYKSRPLYTLPEILRSNLAEVILRMIALNLGDVSAFPFIDGPPPKSIKDGYEILLELGAIERDGRNGSGFSLTQNGKMMASLPVDPRISRMLIEAQKRGCLEEIAVIAAALSCQDPRERPTDKIDEANRAHRLFMDIQSDFITLLNIWSRFNEALKGVKITAGIKKFCRANYLSFRRMKEWRDIYSQIQDILLENGMKNQKTENEAAESGKGKPGIYSPLYTAVHKSVLSGFLSNIAVKKERNMFSATKEKSVLIFPGSGLFKNPGTWIVAAEMIETSKLFARTVANIESSWIEEIGKERCRYSYHEPHWERTRGEVVALEQVSLYGLVIASGRSASYGKVNPKEASDIFIRRAIVDGDIRIQFPFMDHNKNLKSEIIDLENRVRRRDIFAGDEVMYEFYRKNLPDIYDIRTFSKYIKSKGSDRFLRMTREDFLRYNPDEEEIALYPDNLKLGDKPFQCLYSFDPGKPEDGVTVKIPSAYSGSVPPETTEWLVPGLLKEKITALIKGLPKEFRKKLLPVPRTVETIMAKMPPGKTSLKTALSGFIYENFGIDIPASEWSDETLPEHLKMRILITGSNGEELCSGRDKLILAKDFSAKADSAFLEKARKKHEIKGITAWDFADIPESVIIKINEEAGRIYFQGLQQDEGCVNLRIFESEKEALKSHAEGTVALFMIVFEKELKHAKKHISLSGELHEYTGFLGGIKNFNGVFFKSVINEIFDVVIRTREKFDSHALHVFSIVFSRGQEKIKIITPVLKAFHETMTNLQELKKKASRNRAAYALMIRLENETARLLPVNFMQLYEPGRLLHIPRYLQAVSVRAQRGITDPEKEKIRSGELEIHTDSLEKLLKNLTPIVSEEKKKAIEEYFWLIEEYKVSLFAQELKTPVPVSAKRLDKKFKEIERMV